MATCTIIIWGGSDIIPTLELRSIESAVERVFDATLKLLAQMGEEGQNGCHFGVYSQYDGKTLMTVTCGHMSPEWSVQCSFWMFEKATRLLEHKDHTTSYESRNPEADQWGGASENAHYIFSVSGFEEELLDEAMTLVVAILGDLLSESVVLMAISDERNPFLRPLLAVAKITG